jgi:hypothetical protein
MEQLSSFFGKKLLSAQQDFYFEELAYIPGEAFFYTIKVLQKTRKPNPGSFPTIEEIQAICPPKVSVHSVNPNETEEQYHRRVTIRHLWEAVRIYERSGRENFIEHCRALRFSRDDMDRCECKTKKLFPEKFNLELKKV